MVWSTQFEANPSGSDFGYVMGSALRATKEEFKTRMEAQHNFDETASAEMSHRKGYCTVVGISDGGVTDSDVPGAVEYDPDTGIFYRNTGGSLEEINTFDGSGGMSHGDLTGLEDNDHTQYFLADGSQDLDWEWEAISWHRNLEVLEVPDQDTEVMTRDHSENSSPSGGMQHPNDVIDFSSIDSLYLDIRAEHIKIKEKTINIYDDVLGGSYPGSPTLYRVDLEQDSFFPWKSNGDGELGPIYCHETLANSDYVSRFAILADGSYPPTDLEISFKYIVETI